MLRNIKIHLHLECVPLEQKPKHYPIILKKHYLRNVQYYA
jgi:hypothetical protein